MIQQHAAADLDDLLEPCFEADNPFDWWLSGRDQWWRSLAEASVPELLGNSPLIRTLAESGQTGPGYVSGPAEPYRQLLIPSAIFKRGVSISDVKDVVGCNSSGTRGSVSTVPRDDATLQRFFSGVRAVVRTVVEMGTKGFSLVSLLPSLSSERPPWTSYIVAGLASAHPMTVPGQRPAAEVIDAEIKTNAKCILMGSPQDVLRFADEVHTPGDWAGRLIVMTVGGWKTSERESISPVKLRRQVSERLGIEPKDIRDGYSMVEINTAFVECQQHRKHIPPWVEVAVMSPRRFEPVEAGVEGMLAFFDPTATSFPGFILSEDVGVRREDPCPCGIPGPSLMGVRRMTRVEARGCALASVPIGSPAASVPQMA